MSDLHVNQTHPLETPPTPPVGAGRGIRLPAWLMSATFHLVLVLTLAMLVRESARAPLGEPERSVSIVLARRDENSQQYYQDQPPAATTSADSARAKEERLSPPTEAAHDALPPADAAELRVSGSAALPLPGEPLLAAEGDSLVQAPRLTAARLPTIASGIDEEAFLANDPVRNRPPGPTGPTARLSLFGMPAEGRAFVFLIDRSHSMGGAGLGAIEAAERELLAALANLDAKQRFQIISYNERTRAFHEQGMAAATEQNKQQAGRFLKRILAVGGTDHDLGLRAALRLNPDVVFLLSDGGEPPLSRPQLDTIRQRNKSRAAIHCIQFGFGPLQQESNFLRRLANQNRGTYGYVDMRQNVAKP